MNVITLDNHNFPINHNNTADNSEIMRLLDIACQINETIEDTMLDKEEDDEQSQGMFYDCLYISTYEFMNILSFI